MAGMWKPILIQAAVVAVAAALLFAFAERHLAMGAVIGGLTAIIAGPVARAYRNAKND